MDRKSNGELTEEAFKALKKIVESKFMEDGRYDIEELFDNDIALTTILKKIQFRSTHKNQPENFPNPLQDKEGDDMVGLESYLTDIEYINTTSDVDIRNAFHELSDFFVNYNFNSNGIYWDNFFEESNYSYEYNVVNESPDVKYKVSEFKDELSEFLSVLNSEINPNRGNFIEMDLWPENTGYIVPDYPSLKMQFDYLSIQKTYGQIVKGFKLKKGLNITRATELGAFRDLMEKQLRRQLLKIDEFNLDVKKSLKHFYRICELTLLELQSLGYDKSNTHEPPKDWFFCLAMFKAIYDTFYFNFTEDIFVTTHCDYILKLPYLPHEAKETLINLIVSFHFKKKPIIDVARNISLKIRVTESIIEGIIMDENLKELSKIADELSYSELPSSQKIADEFVNRKENKSGKYGVDVIEPVMSATRDYIIKKDIQDMNGHVATVAVITKDTKAGHKSRENYVRYYARAADRYTEKEEKSTDE